MARSFLMAQLDAVMPVPCPCGSARRAFAESPHLPASVHQVEIRENARAHYHKKTTETYVVLEGEGWIELDGQTYPVRPMTAVMILPGCRHRAIGKMKILNFAVPSFDPADEWFD